MDGDGAATIRGLASPDRRHIHIPKGVVVGPGRVTAMTRSKSIVPVIGRRSVLRKPDWSFVPRPTDRFDTKVQVACRPCEIGNGGPSGRKLCGGQAIEQFAIG
jgi:hypothetical protein